MIAHYSGSLDSAKLYYTQSIENNKSYKTDASTVSPIGLGQLLLKEGKKVEAEVHLSHALDLNLNEIEKGSQDDEPPYRISGIYAIRGDREKSLLWLQKAIEAKWIDYVQFDHGPWFENFRKDPAFLEKIASVRKHVEAMRKEAEKN